MKSRSAKFLLSFMSLGMLCGLAACGADKAVWIHYKANDPTEEKRGNVEFWVSEDGKISFTEPKDAEIIEGKRPDEGKYGKTTEIWIENEVKISKDGQSFVVPLEKLPSVYYDTKSDYSTAEFKIIKDVKLTKKWTAIGNSAKPFAGTFNGNNKKIKNLSINVNEYGQGLFGYATGATIKDISLENIKVYSKGVAAGVVGWVVGGENVLIENCHVLSGEVKSTVDDDLGGIVGAIYEGAQNVVIKNCSNAAKIECNVFPGRVGGIVGVASPSASLLLEDCVNSGEIVSQNSAGMVGGTRGTCKGATFEFRNCVNEGTANVPYLGFFNSAADSKDYLTVNIVNESATESSLPTLFSTWQSGGTEGGILTVDLNGSTYKYFLIPTYTYSVTEGKIVSLSPVNNVCHDLDSTNITEVTAAQWAEFLALNPKAAIYEEDGTYKGVSPTTNCYAPNNYYIKGAGFGGLVNTWVKVN